MSAMTQTHDGHVATYVPSSLTYGLSKRAEIGALYVRHTGSDTHSHSHYGAFAKYQLLPEAARHPTAAVTATVRPNDGLENSMTGVVSHRFLRNGRPLVTAHAGVKWGQTTEGFGSESGVAGFVGLEYPLGRRLRLVGETSTRFDFEPSPASAVGLMWEIPRGPHIGLGFVNIGRSDSNRFFFGVGYPIGGGR
jgi:hypothetical protein